MTDNNTPQTFTFAPGLSIRAIVKDGQPWFIAKEVCTALGYTNGPDALSKHVDTDERQTIAILGSTPGNPARVVVNESGLYSLIIRSHKPEAKAFRKWVTSTVLPTLRKDGLYVSGQEKPISDALTLPELLEQLATVQAKVDALKETQIRAWSRHQEDKEARDDAFRLMRGGHRIKRAPMAPPPSHLTAHLVITKPSNR